MKRKKTKWSYIWKVLEFILHLLAISCGADLRTEDDGKTLLMVDLEPLKPEIRTKRGSEKEGTRQGRQTNVEVGHDYYNFLQQLAVQQQQQQPQQQQQQQLQLASATAQQPQQHFVPQLVVPRDGDNPSSPTRFVLSSDGKFLQESLSSLAQPQQYDTTLGQAQLSSSLAQAQQFRGFPVYVQSPLEQTAPQTLPQTPTQTPRPGTRPRISEYARQQQRLLQEYRDAPLRAQIAGVATRPQRPRPAQPVPTGPTSQSAQVFVPPSQNQGQQNPTQFQDPKNPGIIYTAVPVDAQTYYQQYAQLQQQYAQLPQQQYVQVPQQYAQVPQQQFAAAQYTPEANQVYAQAARPAGQFYYQQPEATQEKVRTPTPSLATSSAVQPQYVPQNLPQQYLIETTKQASQPQYVPQEVAAPQFQYVQQPVQQSTPVRHETSPTSTLLQPVAGRGYFSPSKPPSRSSIYVSRSSVPKTVSLTVSDAVSSEKVPVIRLQPTEQRTYTKQELDALVRAGYVVTPIHDGKPTQYLKPKRQHHLVSDGRTNHVVYENPQDGIQYQYSPGTSDSTVTIKTKKSVSTQESSE
ncbi:hypothetical protein RUM44_013477 [Polyplax serrata]|uniref:Uncharacterized protein n=1 Tax=Polyplax serrata TaxID=468196 RepID=A0ABR1BHZ8_POLSC